MTKTVRIGLEIHVELNTRTKLFCGCPSGSSEGEEPNTRVCPTCLGHPGSKPASNQRAIIWGLRLAHALNCKTDSSLVFSRKNYFYPDLSKNYQITQHETALGRNGHIRIGKRKIPIVRLHIEEDPASLQHTSSGTNIDYNRSGQPLLEIVTSPEIESAEEARLFMKKLVTVLRYLEIFNEKTGSIKADANVSVKETGFVRCEIKNITGFKEIERALLYEISRQKEEGIERQETRGWNAAAGKTYLLRTKETEEEYGYIVDADLVPIAIDSELLKLAKSGIPEMPDEKLKRFVNDYKISEGDAEVIISDIHIANMFETAAKIDAVLAGKWFRREIPRVLNYSNKTIHEVLFNEKHISDIIFLLSKKQITEQTGQKIMEMLVNKAFDVKEYVRKERLELVRDTASLEKLCKEVIMGNKNAVEQIKAGESKAVNFLIGQVMRKTKGTADAAELKKIILKMINKNES